MRVVRRVRRLTRGLRFRITAAYALFFALLLIGVTALSRARLATTLNDQARAVLNQEWATMKGYLRIEQNRRTKQTEAVWYYDRDDIEESRIVLNLRKIYIITDQKGEILLNYTSRSPAVSLEFLELLDTPAEIRAKVKQIAGSQPEADPRGFWAIRRSRSGENFLIRSGFIFARKEPYFVALGSPLKEYENILDRFTWLFAAVIPISLAAGSILGWLVAGRALAPVLSVAQAAQHISGSKLSLRIPTRDADDELDFLISTFNQMIERLESSFQQSRQFSTDVSHELRTPITAIRGQLEVALFTAQTPEQYRDAIINALQDIERLSQTVRALLLLSQAESGQLVLQKARLDLTDIVRDAAEQFQIPAEAAGVTLITDLQNGCYADADTIQIGRLLNNLLSNAMKFTPPGGQIRVLLRQLATEPGGSELVVEDTGCGISPEHLPHIFNRFYRVPGPTSEQGLGLGLSFVAWIVKAHGGSIRVESERGKGTRFEIVLPPAASTGTPEPSGMIKINAV